MADERITPAPEDDDRTTAGAPPPSRRRSGKATAALVCGILSLVLFGIILGAVAIVLGVAARKEIAADPALEGDGMALAGIITGAVGAVLAIVLIALGAGFVL
ncbi:MAG TPA: DUF4190 domain-containing protein [Solirubrobacteraceae bacterium]|nr:DUF4190 domain-containing protein [Solirubrobacteraceae bacterium]